MRVPILTGFLMIAAGTTWGGGFFLTTFSGKAPLGQEVPDAAVLVKVDGCAASEAHKAKLTGTAEGIAGGMRRSAPLALVRTSRPDVWAVKKPVLGEGRWVLAITGEIYGAKTAVLVDLGQSGAHRERRVSAQELPTQVEAALKAKAD